MSTDPNGTYPTGATPAEPVTPPADPAAPVATTSTEDVLTSEDDNNFFARHAALITAVMTAVIVAAVAVTGLWLWRNHVDGQNAKTEAAFSKTVQEQNASVDTVECDGGHCEAIVGGQAYSVLVQEDEDGEQHFGVAPYAGR